MSDLVIVEFSLAAFEHDPGDAVNVIQRFENIGSLDDSRLYHCADSRATV